MVEASPFSRNASIASSVCPSTAAWWKYADIPLRPKISISQRERMSPIPVARTPTSFTFASTSASLAGVQMGRVGLVRACRRQGVVYLDIRADQPAHAGEVEGDVDQKECVHDELLRLGATSPSSFSCREVANGDPLGDVDQDVRRAAELFVLAVDTTDYAPGAPRGLSYL